MLRSSQRPCHGGRPSFQLLNQRGTGYSLKTCTKPVAIKGVVYSSVHWPNHLRQMQSLAFVELKIVLN